MRHWQQHANRFVIKSSIALLNVFSLLLTGNGHRVQPYHSPTTNFLPRHPLPHAHTELGQGNVQIATDIISQNALICTACTESAIKERETILMKMKSIHPQQTGRFCNIHTHSLSGPIIQPPSLLHATLFQMICSNDATSLLAMSIFTRHINLK